MPSRFVVLDDTIPSVVFRHWIGFDNITEQARDLINQSTEQAERIRTTIQTELPASAQCGLVVVIVLLALRYLIICTSTRRLLRAHRIHAKQL